MQTRINRRFPPLATLLKEFEVQFKWLVTGLIFFGFRRSWSNFESRLDPRRVRRVLVLRYDRIGDMVVSLPTFHVLKQRFPHLQIDVLASPANKVIIESDPAIGEVFTFRKDSIIDVWRTLRKLAGRDYDVIIDLVANVSATSYIMLLWVGRKAYKIGVHKNNNVKLYDYVVSTSRLIEAPAVKLHFSGLEPFGLSLAECDDPDGLQLSTELRNWGRQEMDRIRRSSRSALIGINISAGKPNREWGEEKYTTLVRKLSIAYPQLQFLIFCAPSDFRQANRIAEHSGTNVSVIPSGLSLMQAVALLAEVDCVLTPDTSIVHIAASLRIPLVAMYTAAETNYRRWRPFATKSWVVRPEADDSLHGISVDAYLAEIEKALLSITQPDRVEKGD